jgi:hypothetical protein
VLATARFLEGPVDDALSRLSQSVLGNLEVFHSRLPRPPIVSTLFNGAPSDADGT